MDPRSVDCPLSGGAPGGLDPDQVGGPARAGLAVSRRGVVTSPHRLASEAGRAVLAEGGNAIEAAVAIGAVLAVTMPHFCGLGGDAVWLVAGGGRPARCFLGIGQAAAAAPVPGGDPVPDRGPASTVTSAAVVDSWDHALAHSRAHWAGTRSLGALLQPAIAHAEHGFALTRSQAFWRGFRARECADWRGFGTLFGAAPTSRAGERFTQPALAETLRSIAVQGARDFYEGSLARRIAAGLEEAGSPLVAADLAATRTREADPISLERRGVTLLAPPPPTQGVSTLQILGTLDRFGAAADPFAAGSADDIHTQVEAVKQAFLDRGSIADPDFSSQPVGEWLSEGRLVSKAAAIDPQRAMFWPPVFKHADTVFFGAVDAEGRCASVLQSLYYDWGSGVVVGDTGILWQNRGAAFSVDPLHPNAIAPGKRPFYTLNPGIALKGGRPYLVYGTQGADGQPQTLTTILSRALDHGADPLAALSAPRFLLGRTFSNAADSLKIEADAGEAVMAELQRRGHEIAPLPARSPLAGQAGMIRVDDDGTFLGAHDPRSDGAALAV